MELYLQGKHAVVTAAGGRIGTAVIAELLDQGASVTAIDRQEQAEIVSPLVTWECLDLLDDEGLQRFAKIAAELPRIDILVNCIGGIYRAPFLDHCPKQFMQLWKLNTASVFQICQSAAAAMVAQGSGKIINFAAVGAVRPLANHAGYCAAKAGLVALSRCMALELAAHNIQVNVIAPGPTETVPPTSSYYQENPAVYNAVVQKTPAKRLGKPDDHTGLLTFLASSQSDWITGQVIMSDGGMELS